MSENRYKHKTIRGKKQPIHRHVMEDHLGRDLESHEHVYHLDGDPNNNDLENLIVITKKKRVRKKANL
jgi:hypothetical protein